MTWYDFAKEILLQHDLLDKVSLVKASNYSTFAQRPKYSALEISSEALDMKNE